MEAERPREPYGVLREPRSVKCYPGAIVTCSTLCSLHMRGATKDAERLKPMEVARCRTILTASTPHPA